MRIKQLLKCSEARKWRHLNISKLFLLWLLIIQTITEAPTTLHVLRTIFQNTICTLHQQLAYDYIVYSQTNYCYNFLIILSFNFRSRGQKSKIGHTGLKSRCQEGFLKVLGGTVFAFFSSQRRPACFGSWPPSFQSMFLWLRLFYLLIPLWLN